ncbi:MULTISPECIES: CBS domain-containing protein [Methylosinus]|uniref:CBS domain-containing protein n=1 Tax=Methylosinus trichosporium (strain ATCC 35070 / NCIMB 11131 / UNIQEM 75 / OB3b) TaxID=595536 RepID=A0A2D2D4N6_METT3|nr:MULTISPECIES: CBS domain-containing protein [Methylosinus]ATQ69925.1 CBS domain-containing protein [Methylosinus trichosporium OB3b]OBS53858.1 inosine-5-monophosphate dehydrogenase [Methylosinus sp. 3S-1]
MNVARILAHKGTEVATTAPSRKLLEAAADLTRRGIGALVVVDADDMVIGLITERDIVAAIARHGVEALYDEVARFMTRDPMSIDEDHSLDATMEAMTIERRRHLPVMRDGRLAGIVSIGDVVKCRIDEIESERRELFAYIASA